MKRVFGVKKDKEQPSSIQDASDKINKRGDTVDDKLKKLDAELSRYKEQIKRTRPGPAQEAIKARAMLILKQKRTYEGQRDKLFSQTLKLDQVAFAFEGFKDAQQTRSKGQKSTQSGRSFFSSLFGIGCRPPEKKMSALKSANKDLKGMMKTVKIQDVDDNLQDEMMNLIDVSNEIQETLGRSYNVPDNIDEDEIMVMGELDALEADMGSEADAIPSLSST